MNKLFGNSCVIIVSNWNELFWNKLFECPTSNFGPLSRVGLINPMLITAFYLFRPEGHVTMLVFKARPSACWGLNREPSDLQCNGFTHLASC